MRLYVRKVYSDNQVKEKFYDFVSPVFETLSNNEIDSPLKVDANKEVRIDDVSMFCCCLKFLKQNHRSKKMIFCIENLGLYRMLINYLITNENIFMEFFVDIENGITTLKAINALSNVNLIFSTTGSLPKVTADISNKGEK